MSALPPQIPKSAGVQGPYTKSHGLGRWLSQFDTYQLKVRTEFRSSEPNKCQVVMVAHLNPNVREADTEDPQSKKTSYNHWAVLNQGNKRYPIPALGLHMLAHTNMCTCTDMHPCTHTHGHAYIWKNKCYLHKTITYLHTWHLFYIYNIKQNIKVIQVLIVWIAEKHKRLHMSSLDVIYFKYFPSLDGLICSQNLSMDTLSWKDGSVHIAFAYWNYPCKLKFPALR